MKFSVEDAFDARDDGEPIMLRGRAIESILVQHAQTLENFLAETERSIADPVDAAALLEWLGY